MIKLVNVLLACLIAVAFIAAPLAASAGVPGQYLKVNSGFCKSGKHVAKLAKCKENGGKL
jgi:hypothetical protein